MKIQPESRSPAFATRKAAVLKTAAAMGLASTFALQSCDITDNGGLAGDPVMPPMDYSSSDEVLSSSSSALDISSSSSSALAGMSYAQMPESSSSSANDSLTSSSSLETPISSSSSSSSSSAALGNPIIVLPTPDPIEENPPLSGLVAPGTFPIEQE